MTHGSDTHILVVGMSHVGAIARALTAEQKKRFTLVNLNADDGVMERENRRVNFDARNWPEPTTVCLTISGNFHHIFGLFEQPEPFRLGDAEAGSVPADPGRRFVPYDLLYAYFETRLKAVLGYEEQFHARFPGARFIHLCTPPPIADEAFLRENPGQYFAKHMHRGFAPPDMRLRLYRIQSDIYAGFARKLGATFLRPDPAALDANGFLARDYWNIDPTHGNTAYGRLVVGQILALEDAA